MRIKCPKCKGTNKQCPLCNGLGIVDIDYIKVKYGDHK